MNTNVPHKEKAASGVGAPDTAMVKSINAIIAYQKGKVKMTREEMHVLLDAAIDATQAQSRYDIELRFYPDYDGEIAAKYEVHDTNMDKDICYALHRTDIVAIGIITDSTVTTVWDAVRVFAHYKEGAK